VLIRQLPITMVKPSSLWKLCPSRRLDIASVPANELKPISGGVVHMGRPQDHSLWGWVGLHSLFHICMSYWS
jgi:hypothetical protein